MNDRSSDPLSFVLQVSVREGQLEPFGQVMQELVASTRNETGAVNYEWFIDDSRTQCHICERYESDDAFLLHAQSFGVFAERFLACVEPVGLNVYGNPGEEVRAALAGFGPVYFATFGGFARR